VAVGVKLALADTLEGAFAAEPLPKGIVETGYGVLHMVGA